MTTNGRFQSVASQIASSLNLTQLRYVGRGSFKETYYAETPAGKQLAVKVFDPERCDMVRAEREVSAMRACSSENLAMLYECGSHETSSGTTYLYLVEEFISGGTLASLLSSCGTMDCETIRKLGESIVGAIRELEARSLVHRDIKPDNIMFREPEQQPVLVDFGLVRDLSRSSITPTFLPSGPGTPYFAAPEQLNNDKHLIDWRTDQFSMGVVLGMCLTGDHPYRRAGMTKPQVVESVAHHECVPDEFVNIATSEGFDFICRMLSPWPIGRYQSVHKLMAAMRE